MEIANLSGVKSKIIKSEDDFEACNELLKLVKPNKEYTLSVGQHTAIVKKQENKFYYLELQGDNGWKKWGKDTQWNRFGCLFGYTEEVESVLIDCKSLYDNNEFEMILGFLNTKG